LIWSDSVAPETCIDIDARHIPGGEAFMAWLAGFGFFAATFLFVVWTDPKSRAPVASKASVLNEKVFLADIGMISAEEAEEDHHGADHEEEEDDDE
jgi:hypothetical protein